MFCKKIRGGNTWSQTNETEYLNLPNDRRCKVRTGDCSGCSVTPSPTPAVSARTPIPTPSVSARTPRPTPRASSCSSPSTPFSSVSDSTKFRDFVYKYYLFVYRWKPAFASRN
jgi:hypothetical protein